MKLRERQVEASDAGFNALTNSARNSFIYACCGFGKSLVISDIVHRLNDHTLILQPTKEILEQNVAKLETYGLDDIAVYSDSLKRKEIGKYTYATIGSIYKNPELFKHFKFFLIDEVHRVSPSDIKGMYGKFFSSVGNPKWLGLTGSPYRNVTKLTTEKALRNGTIETDVFQTSFMMPLNRIFNKDYDDEKGIPKFVFGSMIFKAELQEQINLGYLCEPQYNLDYCSEYNYDNLRTLKNGSEFDSEALDAFLTAPNRIRQALQVCLDHDSTINRNIIFCGGVRQAYTLAEMGKKNGLSTGVLTGKTPQKERRYLLDSFRGGDIKHMFNVGTMTTGLDVPAADTVTYVRPTLSVDLWVQSIARIIRKDPARPEKVATVYDVAGVSKRLGKIEKIRIEKEMGFKDIIMGEFGQLSNVPLFKFKIENGKKVK